MVKTFAIALFPGFQALDVFGPVDILNLLARTTDSRVADLEIFILAASLDPVSTAVQDGGFGQSIVPTHTFQNAPSNIDVLLVPGGLGTRNDANITPVIEYLRTAYPTLKYLLTVCTGSAVAARAGILDGKRATTNKRAWKWAISNGPSVDWVLKARWVTDGNLWTSSGISAGIDMMYSFVGEVYGEDMAKELAIQSEYIRNLDSTDDPFADLVEL
ncbi:class I glutamine amidotransferase-like protein [Stachybotrys elegans]|uniref:Class I glutamine amidotransferase-like protein n=1 Tax=Stachybotrys elegans TaxID=80388 RepID=A0A8K0SE65_9HYPO|nr:class I glutamine amidotransferase-like protein [Stachybotrys elegans]